MTDKKVLLGVGKFGWTRYERIGDRYGYVNLWKYNGGTEEISPEHIGKHGKLFAIVKETRQSGHIGDMFHGIGPNTPEVGEEIVFGTGALDVTIDEDDICSVGLKPDDGREYFWLEVPELYRAHDQTVELWFEYE